jgi:esterase
VQLYSKILGESGQDIIILHGLLGRSDNWMTIAKILSENFRVHLLDIRNHGKSFHHNDMNYKLMCEDVFSYVKNMNLREVIIIGHSMGGKIAMYCANYFPDYFIKIVVVDIAPKLYVGDHEYLLNTMLSTPLQIFKTRNEVDIYLKEYIPADSIRLFIMKNLGRNEDNSFKWDCNVESLIYHYSELMDFEIQFTSSIEAYFIRGENSDYILNKDFALLSSFFPNNKVYTIPNASHWVHADNPKAFIDVLKKCLTANS